MAAIPAIAMTPVDGAAGVILQLRPPVKPVPPDETPADAEAGG